MADGENADIGWSITVTHGGITYAVISLDGPSEAADSVEKTHSLSPNKWREFFAGLKDAGEATIEVNFDANEQPVIGDVNEPFTATFPVPAGQSAGASFVCDAFITAKSPSSPIDDRMTSSISWKFSGEPEWNPST